MKIYPQFELTLDVDVVSFGAPAQLSGPPELCDPEEPPEVYWFVNDRSIITAFRRWEAENARQIEEQILAECKAQMEKGE
jgi:hypothetical protein